VKKTIFLACLLFSLCVSLCAMDAVIQDGDYRIAVLYDAKAFPGDPYFVTLNLLNPKTQNDVLEEASVILRKSESHKNLAKASFIPLENSEKLLASFPLSSFLQPGDYMLYFEYRIKNHPKMKCTLGIVLQEKVFPSETVYLNAQNTAIKNNYGSERMSQITSIHTLFQTVKAKSYASANFSCPITTSRVTSEFAYRRYYEYSNGKKETNVHFGIDYGVPIGTDVFACEKGKVVLAEKRISSGNSIVIEHLPGLYSVYYHLDSLAVKENQFVEHAEFLGKSGNTGLSTGPHLHWEVRLKGEAVNPLYFVDKFQRFVE